MKKDTVVELHRPAQAQDLLSTMLRDGAQRLVAQAVQAEFEEFLARLCGERLESGRAAVVRNNIEIAGGIGIVAIQCWRNPSFVDGERANRRFHRTRRAQRVRGVSLRAAHRQS